ncbi:MAG: formate--tetrahydrofolate ligase, partial [Nitrososphaerota archaeon]|nr:formate--tetrahydrofolate ligase [Nitrososphaerota archaeon]
TLYGRYKAKVSLRALDGSSRGKLVLVTGITPTPHGEGKTVVSVGLGMGLGRLGRRAVACIRQPSLGPVFGVKGGGAGGGMATLEPMLDVNLRLTGDIDAITAAHNLLAAAIDNHVFHGNALSIDPSAILWPRVVDVEDRALRQVQVSLAEKSGPPHRGSFIITAASEVMAILCLSRGYADLKARLAKMLVAYDTEGRPVTAGDLKVVGAMAALLKEAMEPNIVQTREGTPAIVHGGPFGNIAHGTCSVVSMLLALQTADYAVVEAGFGSDLGAEKFVDIVVRAAGVSVGTAVVVATVRALRHHGDPGAQGRDVAAVTAGLANLAKHVENVRTLGLRPVVALNIFDGDGEEEVEAIERFCEEEGVPFARTTAFRDGGEGSRRLAEVVMAEAEKGGECAPLYELGDTVRQKVATLVEEMYGGEGVSYTEEGERQLEEVAELGFGGLPVCVAKTSNSLSDDPKLAGRPRGFVVTVHAVEAAAGAGYVIVEMGQISRMPGLPSSPAAERVSLGDDGEVSGVS